MLLGLLDTNSRCVASYSRRVQRCRPKRFLSRENGRLYRVQSNLPWGRGAAVNFQNVSQGLRSLRENAVLEEGHGFSRAVNDTAIPGFSH
jgi:hypothetical protein